MKTNASQNNSENREKRSDSRSKNEPKKTQAEVIVDLARETPGATLFHCDEGEAYMSFHVGGHPETHRIRNSPFKHWLMEKYFDHTGKPHSPEAIKQALNVLEMLAIRKGVRKKLEVRVARLDDNFYYDLGNEKWEAVRIAPGSVAVVEQPPTLFRRTLGMAAQVVPDFGGKLSLLLNYIRLANESDRILLLVYIITCLIPGIPHPILVVSGEKGAAKTTMVRMLRSIIDPAVRPIISMPTSLQDLALNLSNMYMPCYDNMDYLSPEKSDLLCTASTGGAFSKRKLFTDSEESIIDFRRCIAMNGISVVATRSDLLDRSLLFELQRIDGKERKEERDLREAFERDRPLIVGGAFRVLSEAMTLYPTVQLDELFRMADFTRWGYAIAEAAGIDGGGEAFLRAYRANIERTNEEAVEAHPVAEAVLILMDSQIEPTWTGKVAHLLDTLERIAVTSRINTRSASWPKGAHILSRRLKEVRSNLEKRGIVFDIRHIGVAREITIAKTADARSPSSSSNEGGFPFADSR